MNEPKIIYNFMEEMLEQRDYKTALELAKELDEVVGSDYYTQYVMSKEEIDKIRKDDAFKEFYKFEGKGSKK